MGKKQTGFTIVELLIVIVIIGILAAITIVAYNGITSKAQIASLQSDLTNSIQTLEIAKTTGGTDTYPLSLAAANLKASNGNILSYYPNNSTAPTGYCLQDVNGSLYYSVSTTIPQPTPGSCTITNLATNPNVDNGSNNWGGFSSASSSTSVAVMSDGGYSGVNYWRLTVSGGTTGSGGVYEYGVPVTAGQQYTASMYTRTNNPKNYHLCLEWHSPSAQLSTSCGNPQSLTSNWTRLTAVGTAPSTATTATIIDYVTNSNLAAGDVLDADAVMVTTGSLAYGFADGNTYGWSWSGTAGASTSTGPQY